MSEEPLLSALQEEVQAIGAVLDALAPLAGPSRERVVAYVADALGISIVGARAMVNTGVPGDPQMEGTASRTAAELTDIRTLRESKDPTSAVEMAAVVGYYLSEVAPIEDRSETVETPDLERLFKQAGFPLPAKIGNVLPGAAAAGYFDNLERGKYRLNPVGYNLVAHSLPRGASGSSSSRNTGRKAPAKKARAKKAVAKKAVAKKAKPARAKRKRRSA